MALAENRITLMKKQDLHENHIKSNKQERQKQGMIEQKGKCNEMGRDLKSTSG